MSTVASRSIVSSPQRDATATWATIVDLLTKGATGNDRDELLSVAGVAASIISDRYPASEAIIVTCDGPRTRIYCLYDDDAVDQGRASESPLGFDPLKGNWAISFPCHDDDFAWTNAALARKSSRITARKLGEKVEAAKAEPVTAALQIDPSAVFDL